MARSASASKRIALAALLLGLLVPAAPAAAMQPTVQPQAAEEIRLWPGSPPGPAQTGNRAAGPERIGNEGAATGAYSNIQLPRMEVYRPARPNGTAVLVLGGGGYFRIQIGSAARPIARWLAGQGVTAFVLFYRLPADGWAPEASFQDGQRAMRLIRARAAAYGISADKVGVIGSSAGGHLAGMLATQGDQAFYLALDAVDRGSAVPNFAGLIYPVVSLRAPIDTTRTRRELGRASDAVARFSVESHVTAATPPIFLAHALDDPIADPRHSLWMFEAMRAAGRPAELHIFSRGGHSWGLGASGSEVGQWPALFARWARAQGFMN